ncbi:MAG: OadG family protein [Lachnospiraceae bacterium]
MKMTSVFLNSYWDGVKEALSAALGNTVIGILIVFVALIFISFIISLFKFISVLENRKNAKKTAKEAEKEIPVKAIENTVAQIAEAEELSDDLALVAVITAAIQAYEEAQGNVEAVANGLVVRSIRRAKRSGWQNA